MPTFTWTGKDSSGNSIVREISAPNAEEAKARLLAEGCTELVLREDEIMHIAQEGFDKSVMSIFGEKEEMKVTAADRIKQMDMPQKSWFERVKESVIQDRWFYGTVLCFLIYRLARQQYKSVIFFSIALLCWPAIRIWISLPLYYYRQLNKARDWHRWQEVLRLVLKLERLQKHHFIKVPAVELLRCRAKALAGLGHLQEGLVIMGQIENRPGAPSWLNKANIAGIYDVVKQHDVAIEYTRQAIAENPTPVLYADLMNRLVRYKRDTVGARQALAEIEKGTLTELAKPFVTRARGILAYLEGDHAAAKKELEDAIRVLEKAHNRPFRDGTLAIARAYLCCVLARQGDFGSAKKELAQAKEYLLATDEKDLLAECNRLVGAV